MEIELADHFDRMNKVVGELLKGNTPTQIASLTGFKRAARTTNNEGQPMHQPTVQTAKTGRTNANE
mgnify:CR=1 FL=1